MGKCIFFSLGGKFSSFNNTNLSYSFVSQKPNAVLIGLKSRYRQGTFLSRVFRRESFYLFQLIEVINIFWLIALLFHLQSRQHLISLSLSPYSHLPLIIAGKKLSAVKDFCGYIGPTWIIQDTFPISISLNQSCLQSSFCTWKVRFTNSDD